jgi:ADP-heptose:LPS heptosyltransferase
MRGLLICKPDHLGDFVLTLPTVWRLTEGGVKSSEVVVLGDGANGEWASLLPWFPRFMEMSHPRYLRSGSSRQRGWQGMLSTGRVVGLRSKNFKQGMELTASAHDFWGKLWLGAAGCRERRGHRGHFDFLLTEAVRPQTGHQVHRLAQLAGVELELEERDHPREWLPAQYRWQEAGVGRYRLFSPWAAQPAKQWSWEAWKELVARDANQPWRMLVPGEHKEEAARRVRAWGLSHVSLAPTRGIKETLTWLKEADGTVVLDTAVAHYAWVTGTPTVQLFSAASEAERWMMLGRGVVLSRDVSCAPCKLSRCPQDKHFCMDQIKPSEVQSALNRIRQKI